MWESRVLGETSKSLWTPVCGVHRDVISTAARPASPEARAAGRQGPLKASNPAILADVKLTPPEPLQPDAKAGATSPQDLAEQIYRARGYARADGPRNRGRDGAGDEAEPRRPVHRADGRGILRARDAALRGDHRETMIDPCSVSIAPPWFPPSSRIQIASAAFPSPTHSRATLPTGRESA